MNKSRQLLKSVILLIFSAAVITVFRYYSILRPAAFGALYKEPLSAIIVIVLCFFNYFILYPRLCAKRRILYYGFATVFSTIAATILEVLLVSPQISDFVNGIGQVSVQEYYIVMTISLFLRDSCFVFLFFLVSLLETFYDEYNDVNVLLQNTSDLLLARKDNNDTKEKELVTVRLTDIVYCQQNENYAYIYLTDGTKVYRNCSLKRLYELLTSSRVVRISGKVLVFYRHILSYDNDSVYVDISNNNEPVGLAITNTFRQQALQLLKENCTMKVRLKMENVPDINTVGVLQPPCSPEQTEKDAVQAVDLSKEDEPKAVQQMLSFINEHPGCKSSDITEHFHFSLSTANRVLKQLRDEGKIIYEGSKKTGGYYVVSS